MENTKKEITISKSLLISLGKKVSIAFIFSFLFLLIVQHFGEIDYDFTYTFIDGNYFSRVEDGIKIFFISPIGKESMYDPSIGKLSLDFYINDLEYSTKLFKIYIPDLFLNHKTTWFILTLIILFLMWIWDVISSKYSIKIN